MPLLDRESLFNAPTVEPVPVLVPEFGGATAHVATLVADERDAMEELWREIRDGESSVGFRAFVAAFCLCQPDGTRLFNSDDDITHAADVIGKKNAKGISRIFNVACSINGLLKEDVEALEKK